MQRNHTAKLGEVQGPLADALEWAGITTDEFNAKLATCSSEQERSALITETLNGLYGEAADKFRDVNGAVIDANMAQEKMNAAMAAIVRAALKEHGLETGGTGPKVRPVVSCKGTTCQFGLIDTFSLSEKIHEKFYIGYHNVGLPHKFKIAVGGCPNNCVKPETNDLSVIGQRYPTVDLEKCKGCKKCQVEAACPIKIAKVVEGKVVIDPAACNHCGRCRGKCPFDAISYVDGYKVSIGGRWGKKTATAQPLNYRFTTEEEVLAMVEKAICFFRDEGISGERFADTINRLGFDYVEAKLLNK